MSSLINHNVSIITVKKDDKLYGMTCAWIMQCGYTELLALVGSQSVTGEQIKENDIVGVNILSKNQKELAVLFGEKHSNEIDKFKGIDFEIKDTAVLFPLSCNKMVCKVKEILHLEGIEEDNLLYLEVISSDCNETLENLLMSDF